MSRAIFLIALHEMLGRQPTDAERIAFLHAMAREAGGSRVYVAHRQMTADEAAEEITRLRSAGWSVRRIAGAVGWSKSRVAEVVQFSALKVDTQAG